MQKATLRDQYNELKQDVEKLNAKRNRLVGIINEKEDARARRLAALKEMGMKKPESAAYRKKFIASKKKELLTKIKQKSKEVKDAIEKLDAA